MTLMGFRVRLELIDTCWNVNFVYIRDDTDVIKELIDTCWNVN